MKYNVEIIILGILLLAIIIFYTNAINKKFSVNVYVETTYLYIISSLIVMSIIVLFLDKYNFQVSPIILIGTIIVTFISLFSLMLIPAYYTVLKHIMLILFITTLAILTLNIYRLADYSNILLKVIITICVIISAIIILINLYGLDFINSLMPYLVFSLLALIIVEVVDLLFGTSEGLSYRSKIYSWIAVILFTLFLVYDIKKISADGQNIVENCQNLDICVDYPRQTISVLLDIVNLFSNLTNISR